MSDWRDALARGLVIPAHPLALDKNRKLDERRQRALSRYYLAAGAGGLAVGVHTTQFEIRDENVGLFRPVLELAAEVMQNEAPPGCVRIAGAVGPTAQAVAEAALAKELGYHAVLLSLAAFKEADDDALIEHCKQVAEVMPVVGFYLQPAVGGRVLGYAFWRRFVEIENVVAIKVAPFNRYQTIDVLRAVARAGRAGEIALYTGNDDNIVLDLLTPHVFSRGGETVELRFVGGLLGHWAAWTKPAVELLEECRRINAVAGEIPREMLQRAIEVTDANAALFDAANGFEGCIAGIHEVLRRQGLLQGVWCLNEAECLSPGQAAEIDRVYAAYPHLNDDAFVAAHRDDWLR
ncbi:MAG TPA: dihydrodipicolinate synthase family protein [Candidatus Latescibacteria bacterium]|nr:dihydrodipicolinate synthase family protein [Candidatus Handelsmanbacteria bacterium]HIL08404.1 dihydrodipicolinate synthase family protein [Candidatus Latescibacterota bacterium]